MSVHIIKEYIERDAKTFCGLRGAPVPDTETFEPQSGNPFSAISQDAAINDHGAATCPQCLYAVGLAP